MSEKSLTDTETDGHNAEKASENEQDMENTVFKLVRKAVQQELRSHNKRQAIPAAKASGSKYEEELEPDDDENAYYSDEDSCHYDDEQEKEGTDQLTDEESADEGPELDSAIAAYVDDRMTRRVSIEKLNLKMKRQPRPKNLKNAREVKVNNEIYHRVRKHVKIRDTKLKRMQKYCAKAIIASAKMAEKIKAMQTEGDKSIQEWGHKLYDDVFDSITLTAQASYGINIFRVRKNIILKIL